MDKQLLEQRLTRLGYIDGAARIIFVVSAVLAIGFIPELPVVSLCLIAFVVSSAWVIAFCLGRKKSLREQIEALDV